MAGRARGGGGRVVRLIKGGKGDEPEPTGFGKILQPGGAYDNWVSVTIDAKPVVLSLETMLSAWARVRVSMLGPNHLREVKLDEPK